MFRRPRQGRGCGSNVSSVHALKGVHYGRNRRDSTAERHRGGASDQAHCSRGSGPGADRGSGRGGLVFPAVVAVFAGAHHRPRRSRRLPPDLPAHGRDPSGRVHRRHRSRAVSARRGEPAADLCLQWRNPEPRRIFRTRRRDRVRGAEGRRAGSGSLFPGRHAGHDAHQLVGCEKLRRHPDRAGAA